MLDATDPQTLGRFWETVLGTETLTDETAGFETRLAVPDGPVLDLCFQRVAEPPVGPQRLHLEVRAGEEQHRAIEGLAASSASHVDVQGEASRVFADPAGNAFTVTQHGTGHVDAGPLAVLRLEVADPEGARDFWSWLTGWVPVESGAARLRHQSLLGPLLELRPEMAPKGSGKNRIHLDVRLEPGDDAHAIAREIERRGGQELHPDWGSLPWRVFADASGNEFCVLPSPS